MAIFPHTLHNLKVYWFLCTTREQLTALYSRVTLSFSRVPLFLSPYLKFRNGAIKELRN